MPEQNIMSGTLASLPQQVADVQLKAPAVIVVGEVVGLARVMHWSG